MRIEVDPIKCEAHGLCAELFPERITLDEWGYPLIDHTPIPAALEGLAQRTVSACPTLALRIQASLMQSGASARDGVPPGRRSERGERTSRRR
ncbi:MAG: ferredoxin [Solirubrobacteraceae bacterium]